MGSSSERQQHLREQICEYETIVASFERMNGALRLRRTNAPEPIKAFCDRHIELNSRVIDTMRETLRTLQHELKSAEPEH